MSLLYKSNIPALLNKNIKGHIARVGGSVNQILIYSDEMLVQDINILDGGFGSIKGVSQGATILEFLKILARKLKQEVRRLVHGNKIPLDRSTIELDLHYASQRSDLFDKYDSIISSNVLEHSPNVIFFLINFHLLTKKNGWQYHAIPNYRYTYDKHRVPTKLSHFIADFESRASFSDAAHNLDYVQSAIEKDGWQREFHQRYPIKYPFIHFHVFDEKNTNELFSYIFEDVSVDVISNEDFGDNLVFCRNRLKNSFYEKYRTLIDEIKDGVYLRS